MRYLISVLSTAMIVSFLSVLAGCGHGNTPTVQAPTCQASTYFIQMCGKQVFGNSKGIFVAEFNTTTEADECGQVQNAVLTDSNNCQINVVNSKITTGEN